MRLKKITIGLFIFILMACSPISNDEENAAKQVGEEDVNMNESLFSVAAEGNVEEMVALLDAGAPINAVNNEGNTAVMMATQNNHVDAVKMLIEQGADLNLRNDRQDNVLLYAGAEGLLEIVQLAIKAGADTTLTNRFGGTALIPAADRGHIDVVEELLLNSDTDVNHVNDLHWTALLEAVILGDGGKNYQEIVRLLVEHGADVEIGDGDGITPLEHAKQRGFREIEAVLN